MERRRLNFSANSLHDIFFTALSLTSVSDFGVELNFDQAILIQAMRSGKNWHNIDDKRPELFSKTITSVSLKFVMKLKVLPFLIIHFNILLLQFC